MPICYEPPSAAVGNNRNMPRIFLLPLLAIVIGILACATTATDVVPATEPASPPGSTPETTAASTEAPVKAAVIVEQPEVGTGVGKTVPHFEFTLYDGTKRSTAQLSSRGRPVFLFFFATW